LHRHPSARVCRLGQIDGLAANGWGDRIASVLLLATAASTGCSPGRVE